MKVEFPPMVSADFGSGPTPKATDGNPSPAPAPTKAPQTAVAPGNNPSVQPKQPTETELQKAVANLQSKAQMAAPNLRFSIDSDTGRTVIKVTDANTQEVIRQIPSEEILRLDKAISAMQGLLLNKKA